MGKFVIPKGTAFSFTFRLNQKDSFEPQDLTHVGSAVFEIFEEESTDTIITKQCMITDPPGGMFQVSLTAAETNLLECKRADPEDRYFLRVMYNATIDVSFTDNTLPVSAFIREVLVSPTGV